MWGEIAARPLDSALRKSYLSLGESSSGALSWAHKSVEGGKVNGRGDMRQHVQTGLWRTWL